MAINLQKGGDKHSIDLQKSSGSLSIHANLNWLQEAPEKGFFAMFKKNTQADLDLGCMYEMLDGSIGVIQPLGNSFGSKSQSPFIYLDKDDRSGAANDGENMFVFKPELVKRIMFFAMIYEGATDFISVKSSMFFKISNGEEVTLTLDNAGTNKMFCSAALITNNNGKLEIQKETRYFDGHEEADKFYGFGFRWQAGSKD
ncbi:tellurium resistance protein TerA [Pedobacter caeni]|uniref:Tellurite resistance protein TerA n=1 Tax=Pedobacter caeni TaxID=288992 RepID=A0A1M5L2R9_9SPHI|nr:tellurium resistance protein TerA [Pedobacter caeni]SHG59402.1 tellurite resistance protein TerA [Pedobacter caeni]